MRHDDVILLKNFSNEDFVGRWDSVDYPIKAGEEVYFEAFKAFHFSKHLVDRELIKLDLQVNHHSRDELLGKAHPDTPEVQEAAKKTKKAPAKKVDSKTLEISKNKELEKKKEEKDQEPVKEVKTDLGDSEAVFEGS